MITHRLPTPFAAVRRALAWAAVVISGAATLGLAWRAVLLTVAVALGGCAALPSQVERPVSHARDDIADTRLAKIAAASTNAPAAGPEVSGFRLLTDGAEAFAARIALIRRAEKTLDVQYYVIANDASGREFLRELQASCRPRRARPRAGRRPVRHRPGRAVRRPGRPRPTSRSACSTRCRCAAAAVAQRIVFSLHQFSRINHRMHNKLFIADGSFAVTGGRNIADAYFDRSGDANFIDMDVLSSGPGGRPSWPAVFDAYWNSDVAYPIGQPGRRRAPATPSPARSKPLTPTSSASPLGAERSTPSWPPAGWRSRQAGAEVIADAPQKARGDTAPRRRSPKRSRPRWLGPLRGADRLALLHPRRRGPPDPGRPARPRRRRLRADQLPGHHRRAAGALTATPTIARSCCSGVDLHELMPTAEASGGQHASYGSRATVAARRAACTPS